MFFFWDSTRNLNPKAGRGWAFHEVLGRVTQKIMKSESSVIFLVGGFNPSENYARQNEFIFTMFRGEDKTY